MHVDHLVTYIASRGTLNQQTSIWPGEIGDTLHSKLVNAGLTTSRASAEPEPVPELKPVVQLGQFLAEYLADGMTAKGERASDSTVSKWKAAIERLTQFFGYDRDVSTITHDDAHKFRKSLDEERFKKTKKNPKGVPLAENTKRKQVDHAKVYFSGAKRLGLILVNPFE